MKLGKYLLLLVLLGVPVLTYLFLKTFGRNYYDLPKYNVSEVDGATGDTLFRSLFSESILTDDQLESILVVQLVDESCNDSCYLTEYYRLLDHFSKDSSVLFTQISPFSYNGAIQYGKWKNFILGFNLTGDLQFLETLASCRRFTLLDKRGVIRGIYDACDQEEADRLILEIKVLQSQNKR